jgi:hypothetical protein
MTILERAWSDTVTAVRTAGRVPPAEMKDDERTAWRMEMARILDLVVETERIEICGPAQSVDTKIA